MVMLIVESEVHCSLWLFEPRLGAPLSFTWLLKRLESWCDFSKFSDVDLKWFIILQVCQLWESVQFYINIVSYCDWRGLEQDYAWLHGK